MFRSEKTILFVDDDESFLLSVAESMQNCGYRVLTATNGATALSILGEETTVDLVVTDYIMPGMDGLEFAAAVRRRTQTLPIVFLTARGGVDMYFRALKLGAYEVTCKPISIRTLRAIVKAALNRPAAGGNEVESRTCDAMAMA